MKGTLMKNAEVRFSAFDTGPIWVVINTHTQLGMWFSSNLTWVFYKELSPRHLLYFFLFCFIWEYLLSNKWGYTGLMRKISASVQPNCSWHGFTRWSKHLLRHFCLSQYLMASEIPSQHKLLLELFFPEWPLLFLEHDISFKCNLRHKNTFCYCVLLSLISHPIFLLI